EPQAILSTHTQETGMSIELIRNLVAGVVLCVTLAAPPASQAAFVRWTAIGHIFDPPDYELDPEAYGPFPEPLSFYAASGDLVQSSVDIDMDADPEAPSAPGFPTIYPKQNHLGRIGSLELTPANSMAELLVSRN